MKTAETSDTAAATSSGSISFGVTLVSAGFSLGLIAAMFVIAAGPGKHLVESAYPRTISRLSKQSFEAGFERSLGGRILGIATAALVLLGAVVPLAIATTERVWGSIDSPNALGESIGKVLVADDLQAAKKLLSSSDRTIWLPDAALEKGRPAPSDLLTVTAQNKQELPWQVGNLDATALLSWKTGDSYVDWSFATNSTLEKIWNVIQHVKYTADLKPDLVTVSGGKFITDEKLATLKVNGTLLTPGAYALLPGTYSFTADGYKLIAPTDITIKTGDKNTKVSVGESVSIPTGGESLLAAALKARQTACSNLDKGASKCFDSKAAISSAAITSGTAPDEYFSIDRGNYAVSNLTCSDEAKDVLTSASTMTRSVDCSATYKFTEAYHKIDIKTISVPVYTEEDVYDDCAYVYFGYCFGEWTTQTVRSGTRTETREVEGKVIATLNLESSIKFSVAAIGRLDDKNIFTAK